MIMLIYTHKEQVIQKVGGIVMNEELKKIAEKYNWELEVWHGEYKAYKI